MINSFNSIPRFDCHPRSPIAPWGVRLATLALLELPIHIHGESGSGKERCAKLLHLLSPRANEPWVAVNCAALSKGTLKSELFGHRRGAFTGAHSDHKGFLEQADGGTLFLDEIGELPLEIQAHLLRALQEGEIVRMGEEKKREVRFRLISASNRKLQQMVTEETMRLDLFYRIAGYTIALPTLQERAIDLPKLAISLWREREKKAPFPLSAQELSQLHLRSWKGNIRELSSWLYRRALEQRWGEKSPCRGDEMALQSTVEQLRHRNRQELGSQALETIVQCKGNKSAAARVLGIPRTTLEYRLKQQKEVRRCV